MWHPDEEKYSGRGGSENWPGFGGRPPLVVKGDQAFIEFHSDGSNEDWGWKVVVTATFPGDEASKHINWLLQAGREVAYCGALVAGVLIESIPLDSSLSESTSTWIEDQLFSVNLLGVDELKSEENQFLESLIDRSKGSLAQIFISKMRALLPEDCEDFEESHRATYAVMGALMKHYGLASSALDIARGIESVVSPSLQSLWILSQGVRGLEGLKRAPSASVKAPAPGTVHTTPLKQKGQQAAGVVDPCKQYSDEICSRCVFLLRLDVRTQGLDDSEASALGVISNKKSEENVRRLSRVNSLSATLLSSGVAANVEAVKELLISTRTSRTDALSRKPSSKIVTLAEKILSFVQSSTRGSPEQLEAIRELRGRRALYR